ncbi:MAG: carboxypeptidase-like regulatory domain-containing protein, partial [Candidatus Eisenbacteria bacterium]|nr:carboxypeptidase-like regulatory domain-containing protein [Candidatus Eisenbacteria bacterium]
KDALEHNIHLGLNNGGSIIAQVYLGPDVYSGAYIKGNSGRLLLTAITDNDGYFQFSKLPQGTLNIEISGNSSSRVT